MPCLICRCDGTGRRRRLKISWPVAVWVRLPPPIPSKRNARRSTIWARLVHVSSILTAWAIWGASGCRLIMCNEWRTHTAILHLSFCNNLACGSIPQLPKKATFQKKSPSKVSADPFQAVGTVETRGSSSVGRATDKKCDKHSFPFTPLTFLLTVPLHCRRQQVSNGNCMSEVRVLPSAQAYMVR